MVATSSPTGMCSFLLNLAQHAVLSIHFHGRCGVSESCVHQRSPRPQRRPRAANRRANGGGERDHDVVRLSSEFGLQRRPSAQSVTCGLRDYLLAHLRPSRRAVEGWKAFVPQPRSTYTRFPWTWPARGSTYGTYPPRSPSGKSSEARSEPPQRVPRELPHEALGGRAAVPRGASGGVRRRLPLLTTAARRQATHCPV